MCRENLIDKIIWLLKVVDRPLAIHEIPAEYSKNNHDQFIGATENSISDCLRKNTITERNPKGILKCNYREGKPYKEWNLFNGEGDQGLLL